MGMGRELVIGEEEEGRRGGEGEVVIGEGEG